jgi:uncharacterized membrane protein YdcZ (DUF606 family)
MTTLFYYILAFIMGVMFIVTPIANGNNAMKIGNLGASFYNYLMATITALFILLFFIIGKSMPFFQEDITFTSGLIAGVLGCAVVFSLNHVAPKMKAFYLLLFPFTGQMVMGMFIDYFTLDIFDIKRIVGLLFIVVGLLLQHRNK